MARPLRVWQTNQCFRQVVEGKTGQCDAVVAATTKTAAARALDMSTRSLDMWASETGNAEDIAIASAHPGHVFWVPIDQHRPRVWRSDTLPGEFRTSQDADGSGG